MIWRHAPKLWQRGLLPRYWVCSSEMAAISRPGAARGFLGQNAKGPPPRERQRAGVLQARPRMDPAA
jgi:hypothetical protein